MSANGINWRLLVVEDKDDIADQILDAIPDFVEAPDTAMGERCGSFDTAIELLNSERYDILILDLKDDSMFGVAEDETLAGLRVFEKLKQTRFIPVIFYTALAHKVRSKETSFVRVVEKTESIVKIKEEVRKILSTQLPILARRIEDIQREYMWDFVSNHWKEFETPHQQADIAYLMARRLALSLQAEAKKMAHNIFTKTVPSDDSDKIHPMEMYVRPPLGLHRLAGDLLKERKGEIVAHWIILTPSCDFAQNKASHVVLAKCEKLSEQQEYIDWKAQINAPSKTKLEKLESLIGNNRSGQSERYKFLPGTFFIPDLIVDFQQLRSITVESLEQFESIATLDSPFAEALLASFARYFGRLGTPDIDRQVVLNRLLA